MDLYGSVMPVNEDVSGVLDVNTGQHLDKGGLSGSVLAHQRMDLTLAEREIHVLKRFYAGKAFVDTVHFQHCAVTHLYPS